MSQPQNFGPGEKDPLAVPLQSHDQLHTLFAQSARPKDQVLMGIEYEMFAHDRVHDRPLAYVGPTSITTLYSHIAAKSDQKDPFVTVMEHNNLVALLSNKAMLALEPGGQVEIAMSPGSKLVEVNEAFLSVARELNERAQEQNIDLFAIGMHPIAKREEMAKVQKKRYAIMRQRMEELQGLGADMMNRTCSIQLNIDYCSEADLVIKARLAARLMPFLALLCSSSAFLEKKPTLRAMERAYVWQGTDSDRTGFPPIIFDKNFGYDAWIEYALSVPMYFIRRNADYINAGGTSFRDFMANGLQGEQALVRDFADHLTTIFSEVRLKPFLELRSCDSLPAVYVTALSALIWGLFYDDTAKAKASALLDDLNHQELVALYREITQNGRAAKYRGKPVFGVIESLLSIANDALIKLQAAHYLKPFQSLVSHDITIAEILQKRFKVIDRAHFLTLIKELNVLAPPLV